MPTKLAAIAAVLALATPTYPQYTVWYDTFYDQKENSLSDVACSTGEYGLITRGFKTFGDLGTYPFIGGAPQIQSWDSPSCGSCWGFAYTDANGETNTLTFTAIDTAGDGLDGFTMSLAGMNYLTNGNAQTFDGASITVTQLDSGLCGLSEGS